MGNIRLTQVGEQPCFAVADTATNRRNPPLLHALVVSEKGQNPPKEVWGISMPNASKLLMPPDTCIHYGQLPIGAQVVTPPMRLQLGQIYGGFVNASPENPSNRISFYTVEFCLIKDASGATKVHEIQWDKTQERWRYDVCKQ
jgi:hypothetical protein